MASMGDGPPASFMPRGDKQQFINPVLYMSRETMKTFKKLIGAPETYQPNWEMQHTFGGLDILYDDTMEYGAMKIEEAPTNGVRTSGEPR